MPIAAIPSPVLCMERDKKALLFIKEHIHLAEPCSVVGMADLGKDIIYKTLVDDLRQEQIPLLIKVIHATSEDELKIFMEEVEAIPLPVLCIVNLSTNKDIPWFFEKLDQLRNKRATHFVSVILSNLTDSFSALHQLKKSLVRSMFTLLPINEEDASILIKDFEKRFGFTPTKQQQNDLLTWSSGYVGLLKSLYMVIKGSNMYPLHANSLLMDDSIQYRLQTIITDLPTSFRESLLTPQRVPQHSAFLEKYGFTKNHSVINPLLLAFLKQTTKESEAYSSLIFTHTEALVFQKLKDQQNTILSREIIAKTMWAEATEESYSDWAIDQLMHKLREKIAGANLPYQLITKKGQGFVLTNK